MMNRELKLNDVVYVKLISGGCMKGILTMIGERYLHYDKEKVYHINITESQSVEIYGSEIEEIYVLLEEIEACEAAVSGLYRKYGVEEDMDEDFITRIFHIWLLLNDEERRNMSSQFLTVDSLEALLDYLIHIRHSFMNMEKTIKAKAHRDVVTDTWEHMK